MKIVAVILNIVLFAFICLVLVTDGLPTKANYIVFTFWSLMTLILSAVVILRHRASNGRPAFHVKAKTVEEQKKIDAPSATSTTMRTVAIICNIVFLVHFCWAFVDQYPHPEEEGFVVFTVLMVLTPILNLVVLFRSGAGGAGGEARGPR
jgi:hypothetical protein